MTPLTLYRATEVEDGWFGQESFWAFQRHAAERFALWAERGQQVIRRGRMGLWCIEVEEPDDSIRDIPFGAPTPMSTELAMRAPDLASAGLRWLFFWEGPFEGEHWHEAMYLGEDHLQPTLIVPTLLA